MIKTLIYSLCDPLLGCREMLHSNSNSANASLSFTLKIQLHVT